MNRFLKCVNDSFLCVEINRVEVGEAALLEDSIPEGHAPNYEYLEEQRIDEGILFASMIMAVESSCSYQ